MTTDTEDSDPTVTAKLLRWMRQATAPSEQQTSRNGIFSHHAEAYSFCFGLGIGAAALATDEYRYVSALVALALGLNRGSSIPSPKLASDIKAEANYALAGLAIGLCLGALISR